MIDPAPNTIDIEPLRAALAAVDCPELPELLDRQRELREAEPGLVRRTAAGDFQAAAQLHVTRVQLNETIPAEIERLTAGRPELVSALLACTAEALEALKADCARTTSEIARQIDAALAPVLSSLLKLGEVPPLGSGLVCLTETGERADKLGRALEMLEADFPPGSHLSGASDPARRLEEETRAAKKKAGRLLTILEEHKAITP